jgi:asparagine synthase (glutamine-hydrolysing)
MCGIYGYLMKDPSKRPDAGVLRRMGERLIHRGPDDSSERVDGHVALGHRRLAIIDLSACGRQPMSNEDGTVWIVFNGEIYNFLDYRGDLARKGHVFRSRTDTEVILHLYEEHGMGCLAKLNGMFAFALWDKSRGELFLARDRLGIKPLHYADVGGQVAFASEIKALLAHPEISRDLDFEALDQYLTFEYVPAPKSIFRDIRKVLPGEYLRVDSRGGIHSERYWEIDYTREMPDKPEQEQAEALGDLLRRAVRRQLVADVPLGAFLSGGIDSSAICALAAEAVPKVKTFHIGFEEKSFDESEYAAEVARHLGTDHHVKRFSAGDMLDLVPSVMDYLDEPFGDASFLPCLLLSRFTREHVKVSLSGDGGDELFAGYPTYIAHRVAPYYRYVPRLVRHGVASVIERLPASDDNLTLEFQLKKMMSGLEEKSPARRNYAWLGSFLPGEKRELLSEETNALLDKADALEVAESYFESCRASDPLEKLLHCDRRFYLQDDMLVKIDRATMAASLEGRVPLLDHEVVEFVARLPARLKLRGWTTKYLLKEAMKGLLPPSVLGRKKKGFGIPLAKWFKRELRPLLEEMLEEKRIRRQGLFRHEAVRRLLEEHFSGRKDHRKKLYTLLSFQLWHAKYLK